MRLLPLTFLPLLALPACQSGAQENASPQLAVGNPAYRSSLFAPLLELEGRWEVVGPEGPEGEIEFVTSSAGNALREIMFPGADHEMTNMYTLDGDSVVMTHYCAAGNQPRMRAEVLGNGRLDFRFDSVADLSAADESYMGEMSLVWTDDGYVEQHWRSFVGGVLQEDSGMVFRLRRLP